MKSAMLNRRFKKQATVLVSRQTLEQAIMEGQALAENLLQTNPNDPSLDQIEQAVARLQGVFQEPDLEDKLDDAKQPGFAAEIKKDVDMIAQTRQQARGNGAAPIEAGAGSSDRAWTTDRDEDGKPKAPIHEEIPRIPLSAAKKKKVAEPPVADPAAAAPAPSAGGGNPIDYIPTESLLKIISDMPKDEDFAQNKGKQDALIQLTNILKSRPVVPPKPEPGAQPAAMPVAASKNAKGEPFGGKQAPPFGSKKEEGNDKKEDKEASAKTADGQIYEAHPAAPEPATAFVSEIPQSQGHVEQTKEATSGVSRKNERTDEVPFIGKDAASKTAVAPPGWEGTVKSMKNEKGIDNPYALAWSMKDKGFTPHKASFVLRKRGAKYLVDKFAAGTSPTQWTDDGKKGDIIEDGGRTPEVAQAHKLRDEAPAKLERPATTDMMKLASAVKDAEGVGEKLKAMYLDAKPLLNENSTAPVRNFVECIYKAYSLCEDAVKTLNKQELQEKAEEEAAEIKKNNKKSSLLGLAYAAAE
jgi:hypothetical protein